VQAGTPTTRMICKGSLSNQVLLVFMHVVHEVCRGTMYCIYGSYSLFARYIQKHPHIL
jgi:hypothetical protein